MMEDPTLHHVYNTPWALPCTLLSRSWSILRDFIEAGSDLGSVSHDSTLTADPGSLTRSDEGPRHVQSALHPQLRRPFKTRGGGVAYKDPVRPPPPPLTHIQGKTHHTEKHNNLGATASNLRSPTL